MAARESRRRLPFCLSGPWHAKQLADSTGRIDLSNVSAAERGSRLSSARVPAVIRTRRKAVIVTAGRKRQAISAILRAIGGWAKSSLRVVGRYQLESILQPECD